MSNHLELEGFVGLSPAHRIPDTENRNLQTKIGTIQRRFRSTQNELDDHLTKVHTVKEHLKNVQDELSITQRLCNARKNETDTEEHMKMLNEREIGRLKRDILLIENELTNTKNRKRMLTEQVVRIDQSVKEIESKTKWDEHALKTWLEESSQKDEDIMALMKYTRQDEAKVKNLMLITEHMSEQSIGKKRAVENEIMVTTGLQVELDKTASHFRRSHLQRQELIKRWEDIIEQMHQRDRDIDLLATQLDKVKAEVRSIEEEINKKQDFYDQEQRNNNDCQIRISVAERQAAKLRMQYSELEQTRLLYENELSSLKRVVERTEKDRKISGALVNQMKKQFTDRREYLDDIILRKHDLINKKHQILDAKYTAEEKATQMDQLYLDEQEREITLNNQGKNLEAEINASVVTLNHLKLKITKLDAESSKQYEVLYHQEYEIQSFERRLNRMQGEKSTEVQAKLQQKISELQSEMKRKHDEHIMLINQTRQIQEETKRLRKYLDELNRDKLNEQIEIDDIDFHDNHSKQLFKKLNEDKQNLLVEEQFMRVELKRLRSLLNSKADRVTNLETRRLQLQTVIRERRSEISISQAKLRQQILKEEGRTSEVSSELHDQIAKIDKLKKKYETVQISMAPPDGVNEEQASQAYYVIKAVREKEELQRKGDEFNKKIHKAEQELLALQNTLRMLNHENTEIKSSLKKPYDKNEKKRQHILRLENDCKDIEENLIQTDENTSSNQKSALNAHQQTDSSIEDDDSELRLLQEFNKNIDALIDRTISMDLDAKYCYDILKDQFKFDEASNTSSVSLSIKSCSTHSSMSRQSRVSLRPTLPIVSEQLSIEGKKLSNGTGHRQQKASSSIKRVTQ